MESRKKSKEITSLGSETPVRKDLVMGHGTQRRAGSGRNLVWLWPVQCTDTEMQRQQGRCKSGLYGKVWKG